LAGPAIDAAGSPIVVSRGTREIRPRNMRVVIQRLDSGILKPPNPDIASAVDTFALKDWILAARLSF